MSAGDQKTWEYRIVEGVDEGELNALGREGWELVGAGTGGELGLFFKRPVLSFRERVTLEQKRRYYELWGVTAGGTDKGAT